MNDDPEEFEPEALPPAEAPETPPGRRRALQLPSRSRREKMMDKLAAGAASAPGSGRRPFRNGPAPLPRGVRIRLTVVIPLVVTFLVMLGGFLALWISYPLFFEGALTLSARVMEFRVMAAFALVAAFSLLSLLIAVSLARSIANPLRALTSRVQSLRPAGPESEDLRAEGTEIGALGSALEGVMSSFSSLMLDSYTLRSLEGGVVTLDREGIVTSCNAVGAAILQSRADELTGHPFREAIATDPTNRPFLDALAAALRGTHVSSAESIVLSRSGYPLPLGYSLSPLRDEAGGSLGVVLTFKDLAERKATEQRIRRTETLALIGAMATNVAHEIRNPLGAMSGLVELIRGTSPLDSPARRYSAQILDSIERINRICQELLTVGNPEPQKVEPLDINALVRKTLEFSRFDSSSAPKTTVRTRFAADLPRVPGDGERLAQVLLNILRNAYQACKDGGEVTLVTRTTDQGVAIAVHNTGPHIPPEQMKQLFTVFYTTKRRGTGLGLAISQQLVHAHGGRILVDSAADLGTTFTIELPLIEPPSFARG
jgi:two-component system, NtrC family, nitrogen regulation sensor histidine kinase GlnL